MGRVILRTEVSRHASNLLAMTFTDYSRQIKRKRPLKKKWKKGKRRAEKRPRSANGREKIRWRNKLAEQMTKPTQ